MRTWLKKLHSGFARKAPPEEIQSVVSLFRELSHRNPDSPAIRCEGRDWNYGDLDGATDWLASTIVERLAQASPDAELPVGVITGHDEEAIVGILSVLKAGRPFVHLSPHDPVERRQLIAEAASIELAVVGSHTALPSDFPGNRLLIPPASELKERSSLPLASPPEPRNDSDLAVVFTTGQTGTPTGVRRAQNSVIAHVQFLAKECSIGPSDRIGMTIPCSFGAGLNDVFLALLTGACLCPFPLARDGIPRLLTWLESESISYLHLAPSVLRSLLSAKHHPDQPSSPRWFKIGGEPFFDSDLIQFRERFGSRSKILLSYGASETGGSIATRVLDIDTPIPEGQIAVGKPLPGRTVEIVDPSGQPVGAGESGEIVVTGSNLSSGFFQDPQKTASRFLPVEGETGSFRFLTRDLGRWDEQGNLCHLGRLDGQIKIHGVRVNPAGIEALLRNFSGIADAAVVREGESDRLTAFLRLKNPADPPLEVSNLRDYLNKRLARGTLPHSFRFLKSFPRKANGKVDRSLLSQMASESPPTPSGESPISPRDPWEAIVLEIWGRLLNRDQIGIYDDFFELGGDSLAAVKFQAEFSQRLGMEVPVAVLLGENPTVAHVVEQLRHYYWFHPPADLTIDTLESPSPTMMTIRSEGNRDPVLFLPGGFGSEAEMMLFTRLIRFLDPGHPVFGFRATTLYQAQPRPQSIPETAITYLDEAREVIAGKRPIIVGNCIAGMVAFEMARLLSSGNTHPILILIDSTSRRGWRRGRKREGPSTREGSLLPEFARHYFDLFENHIPGHYAGPIDLMIGDGYHDDTDPTLGWQQHASGKIEIHRIPGNHFEAVRGHRETLGQELGRLIGQRTS